MKKKELLCLSGSDRRNDHDLPLQYNFSIPQTRQELPQLLERDRENARRLDGNEMF